MVVDANRRERVAPPLGPSEEGEASPLPSADDGEQRLMFTLTESTTDTPDSLRSS